MKLFKIFFYSFIIFLFSCQNLQKKNNDSKSGERSSKDQSTPTMLSSAESPEKNQELRNASLEGMTEQIEQLIREGANVNSSDEDGRTALMLAAFNGHVPALELLLNANAIIDVADSSGRTALMYACTGPFPDAVKLLLKKGSEINKADTGDKFTPLMYAASEGNLEVVKVLLDNNADPRIRDKDDDDALEFARRNGHSEVVKFLERL